MSPNLPCVFRCSVRATAEWLWKLSASIFPPMLLFCINVAALVLGEGGTDSQLTIKVSYMSINFVLNFVHQSQSSTGSCQNVRLSQDSLLPLGNSCNTKGFFHLWAGRPCFPGYFGKAFHLARWNRGEKVSRASLKGSLSTAVMAEFTKSSSHLGLPAANKGYVRGSVFPTWPLCIFFVSTGLFLVSEL